MFLAITSIGWGFNWPVTKYLLSELPPLTLRGSTGVVGAACWRARDPPRPKPARAARNGYAWCCGVPQCRLLDDADGIGAALAAGQRGCADRLHHAGMGLDPGLADSRRAAESVAGDFAGDGVRRPCRHHGRQWICGKCREDAGNHHGARRRLRLCGRHRSGEETAACLAAAFRRRRRSDRLPAGGGRRPARREVDVAALSISAGCCWSTPP